MTADIIIQPVEGAVDNSILDLPATLRVYESSHRGMLTVLAYEPSVPYAKLGTRLTPEQAVELHNTLSQYLDSRDKLERTDAYQGGHDTGFWKGRDSVAMPDAA